MGSQNQSWSWPWSWFVVKTTCWSIAETWQESRCAIWYWLRLRHWKSRDATFNTGLTDIAATTSSWLFLVDSFCQRSMTAWLWATCQNSKARHPVPTSHSLRSPAPQIKSLHGILALDPVARKLKAVMKQPLGAGWHFIHFCSIFVIVWHFFAMDAMDCQVHLSHGKPSSSGNESQTRFQFQKNRRLGWCRACTWDWWYHLKVATPVVSNHFPAKHPRSRSKAQEDVRSPRGWQSTLVEKPLPKIVWTWR